MLTDQNLRTEAGRCSHWWMAMVAAPLRLRSSFVAPHKSLFTLQFSYGAASEQSYVRLQSSDDFVGLSLVLSAGKDSKVKGWV